MPDFSRHKNQAQGETLEIRYRCITRVVPLLLCQGREHSSPSSDRDAHRERLLMGGGSIRRLPRQIASDSNPGFCRRSISLPDMVGLVIPETVAARYRGITRNGNCGDASFDGIGWATTLKEFQRTHYAPFWCSKFIEMHIFAP